MHALRPAILLFTAFAACAQTGIALRAPTNTQTPALTVNFTLLATKARAQFRSARLAIALSARPQ